MIVVILVAAWKLGEEKERRGLATGLYIASHVSRHSMLLREYSIMLIPYLKRSAQLAVI